ncbi:hypothetical protein FGO68_gene11425 [Halteria grandinella]|uniref:Uncharacterized protein n=1 Tax=Halteria grandinella TaxID=5974 RepID=A0A8J8P3N7_HALGN|nr:hypothetical protein FGO68_gene11425 [Halteria grandinella]
MTARNTQVCAFSIILCAKGVSKLFLQAQTYFARLFFRIFLLYINIIGQTKLSENIYQKQKSISSIIITCIRQLLLT